MDGRLASSATAIPSKSASEITGDRARRLVDGGKSSSADGASVEIVAMIGEGMSQAVAVKGEIELGDGDRRRRGR